jgi:hypothetical protein
MVGVHNVSEETVFTRQSGTMRLIEFDSKSLPGFGQSSLHGFAFAPGSDGDFIIAQEAACRVLTTRISFTVIPGNPRFMA